MPYVALAALVVLVALVRFRGLMRSSIRVNRFLIWTSSEVVLVVFPSGVSTSVTLVALVGFVARRDPRRPLAGVGLDVSTAPSDTASQLQDATEPPCASAAACLAALSRRARSRT